ncbi:MAG: bifunctional diaminohydroxyphosphoribosylaminopyrimidine deaminase/5-amino-6-(5-phosphoribosylamino)uracil reductase RibD [Halieaceae bacterium]
MTTPFDTEMMARAVQLARRGRYRARPNPTVGCVLVRDGAVIGEGTTQIAGANHAEIEALQACTDASGATAYVTLEPCSHQGKTGPCADALIAAGISRAVIAMRDPNPAVAGEGIAKLSAAGIAVDEGLLAGEAETVNPGFYQRMRGGRPRLRIKLAASLDGRTAMASGESQWITGPAARADVQKLRAESGAIMTGVGTVLSDNPALTVRDESLDIPAQPLRVIVDSRLRTPADAAILRQPGSTLLAYTHGDGQALSAAGAELLQLPEARGRVDLPALIGELAERQINDILVECGPRLAGALVEAGLADEIVVYMAPTLLGSNAQPLLELPLDSMAQQRRLQVKDLRQVGEDYRWTLTVESNRDENDDRK